MYTREAEINITSFPSFDFCVFLKSQPAKPHVASHLTLLSHHTQLSRLSNSPYSNLHFVPSSFLKINFFFLFGNLITLIFTWLNVSCPLDFSLNVAS